MASRYDVAARLAEGEPAVDHIGTYVRACQSLGYQQPDLTAHASQVRDWYDADVGLDLRVLDGDAGELRGAVTTIDEALWVQRTQVTELAAAWRGSGAESAARFLQRHCDAAEEVAGHIRTAAEQCATLRDDVWQAIDGKVATTVAIDERSAAERSTWLEAAQAVTAGDRSAAEMVLHQQVMPFVDNDIRNDWLAAMSAANASVAASYDEAIHALASTRDVRFDIPGDLGPRWRPQESPDSAATPMTPLPIGPLPSVPAAAPAPQPIPEAPQPPSVDNSEAMPPDATTPIGDTAGLSTGAGGLGGFGGVTDGIGGVVGSIVDSIGTLLGSLVGGSSDGLGEDAIDPDDDDPVLDDADDADEASDAVEPASLDEGVVAEAPAVESPPPPAEPVAEPEAQPVDPPRPDAAPTADQPPPADVPAAEGSTPCEIAEDQLPQAGQ